MKPWLLSVAALTLPLAAPVEARKPIPAVKAPTEGMVSAADPRAAAAGVEILRAGGSATDAAIATMLALNVVEPQSSGIGGGSYWVRHGAKGAQTDTIDARETAPMAATPEWFYGPDGRPLTHAEAVPGGRSVGVPGALRGMALAHAQGGKLPWARLFQPAIRLARDGFALTPRLQTALTRYGGHVDAATRARLTGPDGQVLAIGSTIRNPEQAALLERIAKLGPNSFYVGPQAQKLVTTGNAAPRNPSKLTTGGLAA